MKAIRSYHVRSVWVWCTVDFVLDSDEEFNEDTAPFERFSIYMRAQIGYRKPGGPNDCPDRFHVRAHPNLPSRVVLEEAQRFIDTLKQMYTL